MSTPNIFDMYQAEEEEEVPQLQRRSKKRTGETSQGPSAKKSRPEDLPQGTPPGQSPAPTGRTPTPPPAPSEQQNTPARSNPPPAPAREHLSREEAHEARLVSRTIRSAKDRIEHIGKGERVGAAMIQAVELPVDQILNRALNEISSALLSAITARTRAQAYFEQIEAKVLEKHQVKATEELSAAEAKHAKELETVVRERDAVVTKLSAAEAAKDAAVKLREEYRSYNKTHLREIKHLEGVQDYCHSRGQGSAVGA
ncbi:uncharacterized protein LOC133780663 [Humulus lupulus]|uniref:uncharacterized protein LOC133780663 n=1 Tax=Humulus lupulus TaxID=3486 RepID=UPI002B40CC3F|nr:uncharacterized protein LOC133780663 [Humulus lupulus]